MITVPLGRRIYSPNMGTFGLLRVGDWSCLTVEREWRNNEPNMSCVPLGRYPLRRAIHHISTPDPNDDYDCYEIGDVPGRTAIHIHIANRAADLLGCVGVGVRHGVLEGSWAVLNSRKAFAEFMSRLDGMARLDSDLWIEITNSAPEGGIL